MKPFHKITRSSRWLTLILFAAVGTLFGVLSPALAQNGAEVPQTAEVGSSESDSGEEEREFKLDWVEEIKKGGIISFFLGVLSILGLGFAFDRFFNVKEKNFAPESLHRKVTAQLRKDDFEGVRKTVKDEQSIYADAIRFLASNEIHNIDEGNVAATDIAARGMKSHQQRAYMLMVVASVAPLLGLLGTVIGMIEAFGVVAAAGSMGDASILADSISKALITTALGLSLAIPFLMLYHYFRSKTSKMGTLLEERITEALYAWFKTTS